MTKSGFILVLILLVYVIGVIFFASAVTVDTTPAVMYPGESGKVIFNVNNNENFDIDTISINLLLNNSSFSSVGSSQRSIDSINQDSSDSATFTLQPSTDIIPGDYNIPYEVKYTNSANSSLNFKQTGTFGVRVSAHTQLDFSADTGSTPAIMGQKGAISLNIINRGLGDIKSVSVHIFPNGYTLLSSDKVFVGTINADDSNTANFNVIYTTLNPQITAKISYKDFDNNDQTQTVNLPIKVYTEDQAVQLGLVSNSSTSTYVIAIIIILAIWFFWRRERKKSKLNKELGRR